MIVIYTFSICLNQNLDSTCCEHPDTQTPQLFLISRTHNAIKALKTRDNKIRNLTDVLKSNDHYKKNLELKAELDALKSRSKYWSKKDYGSRVETRRAMSKQEHFLTSTPDEEFKGFQTREELDNDFKQWRKKEREAERTMEQLVDEMEVCEKDDNLEEEEDSDLWLVEKVSGW